MEPATEQIYKYEQQGFLVLPGVVDSATCDLLRGRAQGLVAEFDPQSAISIFSTDQQTRTSDEYFLNSGDKIRFFFEEHAFSPSGELLRPKDLSINKIGHALHRLDPIFAAFSEDSRFAEICARLGLSRPAVVQSMYIFKQPGIGGEVTCHQDSTFIYTDPPTVNGFWFALEDATVENGCLWAIPGAHQLGLKTRFLRNGISTSFAALSNVEWPMNELVPLEVEKGTLIILNGLLPHLSRQNFSEKSRHAYTVHFVDREARYAADNWLRPHGFDLEDFNE